MKHSIKFCIQFLCSLSPSCDSLITLVLFHLLTSKRRVLCFVFYSMVIPVCWCRIRLRRLYLSIVDLSDIFSSSTLFLLHCEMIFHQVKWVWSSLTFKTQRLAKQNFNLLSARIWESGETRRFHVSAIDYSSHVLIQPVVENHCKSDLRIKNLNFLFHGELRYVISISTSSLHIQ